MQEIASAYEFKTGLHFGMTAHETWVATRAAARHALHDFVPRAGRDYAEERNEDRGPADRTNVSCLSPWIRVRLLTEQEIVSAVLEQHSFFAAEKFIQEVCWRTYWKGWLQARPTVWDGYLAELRSIQIPDDVAARYQAAIDGRTGIDCFDAFARELVDTGFLHNHARMWFASIWIFTLRLPWVLGADFFMRHLLDGDPASNTLSWRWVGGLQTAGKHYVATAGNIRRYTAGRFRVDAALAENPPPLAATIDVPPPRVMPERNRTVPAGPVGLLVGEDDLSSLEWIKQTHKIDAIAFALPLAAYRAAGIAERVIAFRQAALAHAAGEAGSSVICSDETDFIASIVKWARDRNLRAVLMAEPPVGFWDSFVPRVEKELTATGIQFILRRHPWDEAFFPHATKGFFHLKKMMRHVIQTLIPRA